jgi:hypothetical protein
MGKYVLLIVLGGAGIYALSQQQSTVRTAEHRSERSEEVLARQAARTGFNAVRAKTRTKAQETCADELVTVVGSISGTYETDGSNRGTYQARLEEAVDREQCPVRFGPVYVPDAALDQEAEGAECDVVLPQ